MQLPTTQSENIFYKYKRVKICESYHKMILFAKKYFRELFVKDLDFQGDVFGLLRPEIEKNYDIETAYGVVFDRVSNLIK